MLLVPEAVEDPLLVVVPDDAGALLKSHDTQTKHTCTKRGTYVFPAVVGAAVPALPVIVTFGLIQL